MIKQILLSIKRRYFQFKLDNIQKKEVRLQTKMLRYCLWNMHKITVPKNNKEQQTLMKSVDKARQILNELDDYVTNIQHQI